VLLRRAEHESHNVEAGSVGAVKKGIDKVRQDRVAVILPYRDDAFGALPKERLVDGDAGDAVPVADLDAAARVLGQAVEHSGVTKHRHKRREIHGLIVPSAEGVCIRACPQAGGPRLRIFRNGEGRC
jgi:hypothetical protein